MSNNLERARHALYDHMEQTLPRRLPHLKRNCLNCHRSLEHAKLHSLHAVLGLAVDGMALFPKTRLIDLQTGGAVHQGPTPPRDQPPPATPPSVYISPATHGIQPAKGQVDGAPVAVVVQIALGLIHFLKSDSN